MLPCFVLNAETNSFSSHQIQICNFFLLQVAVDRISVLALETKWLLSDTLQARVAAFEGHGSFTFCDRGKHSLNL